MDPTSFDFELVFNGDFDPAVVTQQCPAALNYSDNSIPFIDIVEGKVKGLKILLIAQPGIHVISTFVDCEHERFKITLKNPTWV